MPVASILSRFLNYFEGGNASFYKSCVILTNYIELTLPLIAFYLIYSSAKDRKIRKKSNYNLASAKFLIGVFALAGIFYSYETLKHFSGSPVSTSNVYELPTFVFVLTIMLPYLYAWLIGLTTAYDINIYAKYLVGIIYRRALFYISSGLAIVITSFIISQYINTILPTYGHLHFNFHETLSILIKVISGIGFYLIAYGINKLIKIEEL